MNVLNPDLFHALRIAFGMEPRVANAGQAGVYTKPKPSMSRLDRKTDKYVKVEEWGESYEVNCPVCGDTRCRLRFSHLSGMTHVEREKNGSTKKYYFGHLYVCYNESCSLRRSGHIERIEKAYMTNVTEVKYKPATCVSVLATEKHSLPKGCLPLLGGGVPEYVHQYLADRRFSAEELANRYWVHFAPKGSNWSEDGKDKDRIFYEDRLIIPVIQGRYLVGYQARIIPANGEKPAKHIPKYITVGVKTSVSLYNRDVAMFQRDMTIVEGVTDAWRVGAGAVALFGKTLKSGQLELMRLLWGFSGSCVVCLDRDDAEARASQIKIVDTLRKEKIFPRGVAGAELPAGKDPADMSTAELQALIEEARATCK